MGELIGLYLHETGHTMKSSKAAHLRRAKKIWGTMKVSGGQQEIMRRFTDSGLSPLTCDYAITTLSAAVDYVRKVHEWDVSPDALRAARSALVSKGVTPHVKHRDRRCTRDEEALLSGHWMSNAVPVEIIPFLIDTPIRSGELAGLKWADVQRISAGRFIVTIRDRKATKSDDKVPVLGRAGAILEAWWQGRGGALNVLGCDQKEMYRAFRKAADAAGLEDMVLHSLRHEGISRLFERGLAIQQVSLVSGHRQWTTLRRYTHLDPSSLFDL